MANEKLRIDIRANDKASGVIKNVNRSMNNMSRSARRGAHGMAQVARALDDVQYGFMGVRNNLIEMAIAFAPSAGWIAGVVAATFALEQLFKVAGKSEMNIFNLRGEVTKLKTDLEALNKQVSPDERSLEQKIADTWDDILKKQSQYIGGLLAIKTSLNTAIPGAGNLIDSIASFFGFGTQDELNTLASGNKQSKKDTQAAKNKAANDAKIKSDNEYFNNYIEGISHQETLNKIYGMTAAEVAEQTWLALQKIDLSRLTDEQRKKVQQMMEVAYAYMGVLDEVVVTADKAEDKLSSADQILNQGISNIISGFAQAAGSGQDLGKSLLSGIGNTLMQLGGLLITTGLGIEAFKDSLKSLNGTVAIIAGVAMVAAGAAFASAANKAGGGGGVSSSSGSASNRTPRKITTDNSFAAPTIMGKVKGNDLQIWLQNSAYNRKAVTG